MKTTTNKALKKFIGERAYNLTQNSGLDLQKIKNALITSANARAVFDSLDEQNVYALAYKICNAEQLIKVVKTSQEEIKALFSLVGYDTVIFDDYEKIKDCKKYYEANETICTYNNLSGRMSNYHMLVVVKKNIENIKRAQNPSRDDEYGTSILNIQIAKNGSQISIKNRYNHTVADCDATLNNNLNNLLVGLHEKVLGYYNFTSNNFKQNNYKNMVVINNIYMFYTLERNNIYYGDFVLDAQNGARFTDKSRYIINVDTKKYRYEPIIFDFKTKKAICLSDEKNIDVYAYTRLLQDKIIKQDKLSVKTIVKDVKKELLQANKKAMQYLHEVFDFDFEKNYSIDLVVGGFTANSLRKYINYDEAILLLNDDFNNFHVARLKNNDFQIEETRYNNNWSDYKKNIDMFSRKSDFNEVRKNNKVAYIIYQNRELKCVKEIKKEVYIPTLQYRLRSYKASNRQNKVNNYNFEFLYNDMVKNYKLLREQISNIYMDGNLQKIEKMQNVLNWSFDRIVIDINNFKKSSDKKDFYSVDEAKKKALEIQSDIKKYIDIINNQTDIKKGA